ncbi:HAD-like domain-containing protein [Xylariomycetidae sp. FL2044]|nr:HAD-like domain-containing protein [Xylariomycetidae sp. FL2044]
MASKYPDLTNFKALSFDVYGTLIDWEGGILSTLRTLTSRLPPDHPLNADPPTEALRRLDAFEDAIERAHPKLKKNENLARSLARLAEEDLGLALDDGVAEGFGRGPGTWPAFPDTVEALQRLGRRYKLIILSNIDNANIASTVDNMLAPAKFDAVYTAEKIGSYKPAHANFEYLFEHARQDLGVDREKGELLHVARSLKVDHVPAKELGYRSVWISRGGDQEGQYGVGGDYGKLRDRVAFEWRFDTLGDFADEVERQFAEKKEKEKSTG